MRINFSKNLAILRKSNGITQEVMAEKCGVSRQAVTKWECGSSLPDLYKVSDIAEILGVSIDELLHGTLEKNSLEQINIDYATILNSKIDKILEEIRKPKRDIIDAYEDCYEKDLQLEDDEEGIPIVALRCLGIEAANEGNYDDAIDFLEQALIRGDAEATGILIDIQQEILEIFMSDNDECKYFQKALEFSQQIQKYGKIMESVLNKRIKLYSV